AAGSIAAIVDNDLAGDPTLVTMGPDGVSPAITIPAVFISENDGNTLKSQSNVNATLAASNSADTLASFSSRGAAEGSPVILKPDIAAPGVNIVSTQTGITCVTGGGCLTPTASGFDPGGQSLTLSGTSMATPHIAGTIALLKQRHPDWDVEELKAVAMNGAIHDLTIGDGATGFTYGPGRVGAGRVDPSNSATSPATAFNGDDAGLVSVSFDTPVVGTTTATTNVRVVNHSASSLTYTLGVDNVVSVPGVSFSFPNGGSITIPAASSVEFPVQMSANGSLMNHTGDPTIAPTLAAPSPLTSLGNLARQFISEAGGYITFSSGSTVKLRVPVYTSTRPASSMFGPAEITTGGSPTGSTTLPLTGTGVCTGTVSGVSCLGSFPLTEVSLVTPFELQAVHPRNTAVPAYADIQYAGVAYDATANLLLFGVSTWGNWSTPRDVAFNILVDPTNTGQFTRVLFNSDPGTMGENLFGNQGADAQDSFITATFNTSTNGVGIGNFINGVSAAAVDSGVFKNRVMILSATPAQLGITGTSFHWKIQTTSGAVPISALAGSFETVGPTAGFLWDRANQGLNFGNALLTEDLSAAALPVTFNTANITANGSLGALLLHSHNTDGTQAQVIPLDTNAGVDLAITQNASPSPVLDQNVTLTLTVSNTSGPVATGVAVTDVLPSGLIYVSDDGGGAYSSSSGLWTVGALGASASATLHIVATVDTTDAITNLAQITANTPLDPNPANNQASVTIQAPREADLAVQVSPDGGNASPKSAITYKVVVTNDGGDPAYNILMNGSFPAPVSSFTASAGVFNPATGAWDLPSLGSGFSETLTATITPAACGASETVRGQVSSSIADPNSLNNTSSASVTSFGLAPVITKSPTSQSLAGTGNITFTAAASGTPTPTVQWQVSTNGGVTFTNIPGATSTTLTVASSAVLDGNQYRAVFTNACGTATTGVALTATFDICLQDNTSKNVLEINSKTGDYMFTVCGTGTTISGKGTVSTVDSILTLTDKETSHQVTASFNLATLTGTAVINITSAPGVSQTYRINDTESQGKGCSCPAP
ncbi:MAG TPA: S8 family serine peptidase, partial [Blastocatellia bacterium]